MPVIELLHLLLDLTDKSIKGFLASYSTGLGYAKKEIAYHPLSAILLSWS